MGQGVISDITVITVQHGFITALLAAGYNEVEIADLTGHKKSNIGRTEAGKTYFHRQGLMS